MTDWLTWIVDSFLHLTTLGPKRWVLESSKLAMASQGSPGQGHGRNIDSLTQMPAKVKHLTTHEWTTKNCKPWWQSQPLPSKSTSILFFYLYYCLGQYTQAPFFLASVRLNSALIINAQLRRVCEKGMATTANLSLRFCHQDWNIPCLERHQIAGQPSFKVHSLLLISN